MPSAENTIRLDTVVNLRNKNGTFKLVPRINLSVLATITPTAVTARGPNGRGRPVVG